MGLLVIKRTRARETRQGRQRWFDEAIARFVDGKYNCHFFQVFMVPRPLTPTRAMRSRTCADVIQPCPWRIASSLFKMAVEFSYEKLWRRKQFAYSECSVRAIMKAVHTKMNNFRETQASLNGKTARYPSRREPNIMEIISTSCGLKVPH